MAYGVLYEFRRTSSNGADMLITISQKDYTGAVKKRALGRAPVIKRENNDHIYGTSCELYAECLVDGEFSHLYTSDAYEFKVEVYKNNILLWVGFVSPELYSEPDIAPPYDVQIIATDGLGELKNYNFKKRGVVSILDHLDTLMANTGLGMDFYVVSGLRYINADGTASEEKDILSVKLDLDHEEGNSCYDVLQGLLSSLNANITQHNGRYLIFRETDFISKASATGVEAFSESGSKINLPITGFGSMMSNQWWPVGQLSTVIEPAKNHLTLKSPNHYKENVLSFDNWVFSGLASYSEADNAYVLPGADSAITQTVDFGDHEVGYRLGLRVRARNVGTPGDEEQNIGIKVEVNGRSYSVGKTFWLVKSANTSGRPINDYLFRSTEGYIEEDLPTPTEGATSSDAQDIDIVVPLHASGSRSYVYAKNVKLTIFNPTGLYDIHVYDVSLVKYEQIKGYEANVIIENMARESESDIDLTITAGDLAPAAGDVFMTGLPLRSSDSEVITKWQIGLGQAQDYLAAMAFDYSRAISLPRMKYSGILNVPGSATILPTLFLRDGTYYFPKTYSYDLYADEITIDLISISAADVSLSSVQISQTSEAAGTMGTTTGGPAGGGSPSAKSLAQLDDVRISNPAVGDIFAFGGKEWENMSFQKVVNEYLPLLKTLGDWFYKTDDGLSIGTKYNLFSEQEMSANGLSVGPGGSGSGLISQVYGITAFGTIAAESNSATFNAYAIDSLYKRIVSLEGKATAVSFVPALTSGKQIGTLSIDGVSKVLYAPAGYAWSEVSGKPTLIESEGVATDGTPKVNRFGLWQGKGAYWSIGHDSNYVIQAYANASGVYLRSLTGGTDSGWKRILREGDAYSKADADNTFLKLTGGSIVSSTIGCPLYLANTKEDWNTIGFKGKSHSDYAYLGLGGDGNFFVTTTGWTAAYGLIHSGNIGSFKAGGLESEYLVSLDNAGYNKVFSSGFQATNRPSENYATGLTLYNTELGYTYQLAYSTTGGIFSRYKNGTTWSAWNTLIHSGNYNSYALPLSGGEIGGYLNIKHSTQAIPLGVESTATDYVAIRFTGANGNSAYLVYSGNGDEWAVTPPNWAGSRILLHSNNYSQYALPLTGGTISNGNFNPLTIKGSSTYSGIGFVRGTNSAGYLVYEGGANWAVTSENWAAGYRLIHSGNYNSYAPKLDGTGASGTWGIDVSGTAASLQYHTIFGLVSDSAGKWKQFAKIELSGRFSERGATFQLRIPSASTSVGASCEVYVMMYQQAAMGSAPQYSVQTNCDDRKIKIAAILNYNSTSSSITLYAYCPHAYTKITVSTLSRYGSDVSIGSEMLSELPSGTQIAIEKMGTSYSTTKLATARTIWGQSFDGTGNVTGALKTPSGYNAVTILDSYLVLGQGMAENSLPTYLDGYNVYMRYGKSSTIGFTLNSSGNVLIGTTTDTSGNKLQVNGTILSTPARESAYSSVLRGYQSGIVAGDRLSVVIGKESTSKNAAYFGFTYDDSGSSKNFASIGFHSVDNILCVAATSYVGIGTTSPAYKLDVNGTLRATGAITASAGVKVASGQALTFLDASGVEHKLTYDSTAGAFKFDGNVYATQEVSANGIGTSGTIETTANVSLSIDGLMSLAGRTDVSQSTMDIYGLTTDVVNKMLAGKYNKILGNSNTAGIWDYDCWQSNTGNATINLKQGDGIGVNQAIVLKQVTRGTSLVWSVIFTEI